MSIPGAASPLFIGAAAGAAAAYQIDRSLRFNSDDSAYLSRTPSSAGNRRTWTWSGWVKRTNAYPYIFTVDGATAANYFQFLFEVNDKLYVRTANNTNNLITTALFRDFSAWYHLVLAVDTTQATASNRLKLYVNGSQITQFGTESYPAQNADLNVNTTNAHYIGRSKYSSDPFYYSDGYLADIHFIDGQALAASDFGEYDDNNVWQPKTVSVSSINDGTTWSSNGDNTNAQTGKEWDKAFDGAIGTTADGAVALAYTTMTWSGTIAANGKRVRVNYASGSAMSGGQIVINSTNVNPSAGQASGAWVDLGVFSADITSMSCSRGTVSDSGALSFCALEVGGEILIDSYNNSTGYGTNGFHLDFSDNSSNAALGTDSSGNSNTWTVNNISVASGAGNDSMIDTPTNYDDGTNIGGNYATLNPIGHPPNTTGALSNGNLVATSAMANYFISASTIAFDSGTSDGFYFEVTQSSYGQFSFVGVHNADTFMELSTGEPFGTGSPGDGISYRNDGLIFDYGSSSSGHAAWSSVGDVIGVAVKDNKVWFAKNNSWISGNPSNGTSPSATISSSRPIFFGSGILGSGIVFTHNFGQTGSFTYTPPTGFKALCTQNLPNPTIADGSTAMDIVLYTGTRANQVLTFGMQPDFVWAKNRSTAAYNHVLTDSVRGASKVIFSNLTNAEQTSNSIIDWDYGTNQVQLGDYGQSSETGDSYVAWAWDGGTSTVSNTDGSITSSVRANPSAGFSIVSYNGDNNAGDTVGHGLNAAPEFILIKNRDVAFTWYVYHSAIGATKYLRLDTTNAETTGSGAFNNTAPTSSVFSLGQDNAVNDGNKNYIAYCWAPVSGYSSFGVYTGNGSTDGPFVYTGHRSRFIMIKRTNGLAPWVMVDTERNTFNVMDNHLLANDSAAENGSTIGNICDSVSNGFKLRGSDGWFNKSSATYAYVSFASHPFKTARAR